MNDIEKHKPIAIEIGGITNVHLPGFDGNYATLCSIDGDDPSIGIILKPIDSNSKVDCVTCKNIYQHCRQFKKVFLRNRYE